MGRGGPLKQMVGKSLKYLETMNIERNFIFLLSQCIMLLNDSRNLEAFQCKKGKFASYRLCNFQSWLVCFYYTTCSLVIESPELFSLSTLCD